MSALPMVQEAVLWSEGMLLAPQHFQQNNIYLESLLQHQMAQLQPYYWGLMDLAFDETALRAGKLRILSLHAVMPDGLVVQYPVAGQEESLQLDVSKEPALAEHKPLTVHLCVPVRAEGAASRSSSIQRFDSVKGVLALDENTGSDRVEVPRLRPRLQLIAAEEVPAKYVALPLFQIRRDLGGAFELTDYHPPLLRVQASQFLGETSLAHQLRALASRVRAKAKELLGVVNNELPRGNATQHQLVYKLVCALPPFEVLIHAGQGHPFQLYQALAGLAGQIAGIGASPIPPLFDPYRHDDPMHGFRRPLALLAESLGKLSAAYDARLFDHVNTQLFTITLPQGVRADRLIIELKPQAGQNAQALAQWLDQAIVSAESMVPTLRRRRLNGARVRALSPDQAAAMQATGGALYELINQPIEEEGRLLPVIHPGAPLHIEGQSTALSPPAAIVLYTPRNGAADTKH